MTSLAGGEEKKQAELENLYIELIEYNGTFDDFLEDNSVTRKDFETIVKEDGYRQEEDFIKYLIAEIYSENNKKEPIKISVTLPNGEIKELSINDEFKAETEFVATKEIEYKVTATASNGAKKG